MLSLNYYFVDVGDNSCYITECNFLVSLRQAFEHRSIARLKILKEHLIHSFKARNFFSQVEEFKMVFVNKAGKISTMSYVEEEGQLFEPIASNDKYDVYLMFPGQTLNVSCKIYHNHIENRFIHYEYITAYRQGRKTK